MDGGFSAGTAGGATRSVSDRRKRVAHLFNLTLPLAAFVAALLLLWNHAVGLTDLALLCTLYVATGLGVTVGFHRYFTHRSFATSRPMEYTLAVLGSLALEGSVIDWVADHRKHHAHTDREGDPHSPHLHDSPLRSLWHAHIGWVFRDQGRADERRYAAELLEDPGIRRLDRAFPAFIALTLALPFLAGWALAGTLAGALTGLLWGGLVRVFLVHHAIFAVNSIGHYFGRRRFRTDDHSTNVFWLAPFSLGESWHHNHHAFPRSAMHGMRWYELDISGLVIAGLERLGLVWNVVRIAPERQRQKLIDRYGELGGAHGSHAGGEGAAARARSRTGAGVLVPRAGGVGPRPAQLP
jgi:stearoyl-CoA desaturase (Delta-9 desaturase)